MLESPRDRVTARTPEVEWHKDRFTGAPRLEPILTVDSVVHYETAGVRDTLRLLCVGSLVIISQSDSFSASTANKVHLARSFGEIDHQLTTGLLEHLPHLQYTEPSSDPFLISARAGQRGDDRLRSA